MELVEDITRDPEIGPQNPPAFFGTAKQISISNFQYLILTPHMFLNSALVKILTSVQKCIHVTGPSRTYALDI